MPRITKEEIRAAYDGAKYTSGLMVQENSELYKAPEDELIHPNKAPEEGGGQDIAYGHKLTEGEIKKGEVYGIAYTKGITKKDAERILELDIIKHKNKAEAKVGSSVWNELPQAGKNLLTDFSFTGTLHKFPKMLAGIKSKNKEVVLNEYRRKFKKGGTMRDMVERNKFSREMIAGMEDYFI